MTTSAVHSAAMMLLLLLSPGILTERMAVYHSDKIISVDLVVENSLLETPAHTYSTTMMEGGILLGAMKTLMASNADFKFTYREDPNFGPFLVSVNGLAGNDKDQTYWKLLAKSADGETTGVEVGIGCYIPKVNEQIILKFTTW